MLQIELAPDLSHCIETVARREYSETMRKLLATGQESGELQERIELLRLFLKTMDFKELRRESEKYLAGGKKVKFVVYLNEGVPRYTIQVA